MELKDIFRHEERRLFPELAQLHARHRHLRERFESFAKFFPPEEGVFPKGVEFISEPDKPLLTVRFCGKRFRFCFDMIQAGDRGQVRCLALPSNEEGDKDAKEVEVGRFTFDGQGISDIIPTGSRDADALLITDGACAYGIVASFLISAF